MHCGIRQIEYIDNLDEFTIAGLGWTKSEVDSVINRARDTITLVVVHDWEGYATEVLDADHAVDLGEVNTDGVDIETSVVTGEERQVSLHYSMFVSSFFVDF